MSCHKCALVHTPRENFQVKEAFLKVLAEILILLFFMREHEIFYFIFMLRTSFLTQNGLATDYLNKVNRCMVQSNPPLMHSVGRKWVKLTKIFFHSVSAGELFLCEFVQTGGHAGDISFKRSLKRLLRGLVVRFYRPFAVELGVKARNV